MEPMLPEMYEVLYSLKDRDPVLDAVKPEEILEVGTIKEKV